MSLRVMTYNVLNGGEGREAHILKVIETARPHVVVLQEIFSQELLKSLSQSLGMSYYLGAEDRKRKVALLSRLPVCRFRNYRPRFPISRNFIEAEIEYEPGRRIVLFGIHPIANLGVIFEIWRLWEATYLIHHLQSFQKEPCLILGDFNAIAPGDRVKTETMPGWLRWIMYLQGNRVYHFSIKKWTSAGFTDCFRSLHLHDGCTLPTPVPNARLDYIFANSAMRAHLKKCWVVQEPDSVSLASDHYPVMAEFNFRE